MITIDSRNQILIRDGKAIRLSSQECEIIKYLIKTSPRRVKYKELDDHVHSSFGRLRVAVCNLRQKLNQLDLNITHAGAGLMIIEKTSVPSDLNVIERR